jgi:hypothetical protein
VGTSRRQDRIDVHGTGVCSVLPNKPAPAASFTLGTEAAAASICVASMKPLH